LSRGKLYIYGFGELVRWVFLISCPLIKVFSADQGACMAGCVNCHRGCEGEKRITQPKYLKAEYPQVDYTR
jgi:hypothetical protein